MSAFRRHLVWAVVALLGWGCAAPGKPALLPVPDPERRYELPGFSVLPPRGADWSVVPVGTVVVSRTREEPSPLLPFLLDPLFVRVKEHVRLVSPAEVAVGAMAFFRAGQEYEESGRTHTIMAIARTFVAREARLEDRASLRAWKEARLEQELKGSSRFRLRESQFDEDASPRAACVRYRLTYEDREVPGHRGSVFVVMERGLSCVHPRWPRYVIDLGESQRVPPGRKPVTVAQEVEPFLESLVFDAERPLVVETITVGSRPRGVAYGHGAVWVAVAGENSVARLDPASGQLVAKIPVGSTPAGVATSEDAVWVANQDDGTVSRIDPQAGRVIATIAVGREPVNVAASGAAVWVTNDGSDTVTRIDAQTNRVVATVGVGRRPAGVAVGAEAVWVTNTGDNSVSRIDPETNRAVGKPIFVGPGPNGITVTDGVVWVAVSGLGLVRIEPGTGEAPRTVALAGAGDVVVHRGLVWVTNFPQNAVSRVDPRTNATIGRPIALGAGPLWITGGGGAIWVGNVGSGTVSRIDLSD